MSIQPVQYSHMAIQAYSHTAIQNRWTALHCTALNCTALNWTALNCTAPVCNAVRCTSMHCTALHCTALHCTALHCIALHCTVLHCTALHCTVLHCITLHCSALHSAIQWTIQFTVLHCEQYILVHCTTLHCNLLYRYCSEMQHPESQSALYWQWSEVQYSPVEGDLQCTLNPLSCAVQSIEVRVRHRQKRNVLFITSNRCLVSV